MEKEKELLEGVSGWTPDIFVNLTSELAWPIVVLLLGFKFRGSLSEGIKNFFKKNKVKEVSATTSGITAKFESNQQEQRSSALNADKPDLPELMSKESLQAAQEERSTQYSLDLLEKIKEHVIAIDATPEEKIEILSKEVSINQAAMMFLDVSLTLFLSQYTLFNEYLYPTKEITISESEDYFIGIVPSEPSQLEDWSAEKYYAFPLSIGLIEEVEDRYRLTKFGASYVRFIRNNPNVGKYLANL